MENGGLAVYFGENLAQILSQNIKAVYPKFDAQSYCGQIAESTPNLGYSQRILAHANALNELLPPDFRRAAEILVAILGEENPNETGMFKHFYWTLPLAKYVEIYGLDDFETSMNATMEITKRGTGEYAVRAFIKKYPQDSLKTMTQWARSSNFHLRRLASEGLRPKLPWASKLELFISDPRPVFAVLEILKEDEVRFVQRSVANNVADYLKVNFAAAKELLVRWQSSQNKNTQQIVRHATRKIKI